jgi:TonB family protein
MKYIFLTLCILFVLSGYSQSKHGDTALVDTTRVYVEVLPKPPFNIDEYISKNLRYPMKARLKGIEGRVIAKFVITENGEVTDCTIVKGIGKECDDEVLRLIQSMPPWKPGTQNGKPVKVFYTLPINFLLGGSTSGEDDAPTRKGAPKWKKKKD